jgi:putative ABC transport system ATP-binding protein
MTSAATSPLLQLIDIEKAYHTDDVTTKALAGVTMEICRGEYVAVSGPSGCGKTTLLSILGLLDTPDAGRYVLEGALVESLSNAERARVRNRQIGFIFQSFNLIGDLTVRENVALPLSYRSMGPADRDQRVSVALERVGLAHRAKHFPSQLSGGQQQRVAVARAVAGDPVLLLADEPTGNLDSANGDSVMALLHELHQQGTTICVVTHDPRYAALAERTVFMLDGRVVETAVSVS